MTIAIKTEGLSKRYFIGRSRPERYLTLRDAMHESLKQLAYRIRHPRVSADRVVKSEELWALKNLDLEIAHGESIGLIGRNGAGKSTLLKVLSRITEPTEGRFTTYGRVASLLEVGTGFHPELSGRENIYLNGAILGMSRAEIRNKFDEIVDFAGIERFLETPVKRYSSGMYVRLAFAVAAHLEPEILVVDEVLAVGDAQFQKKCLGKMEDIGSEGRTVIFVSHQMGSIARLCSRAILLEQGMVASTGEVGQVIADYMNSVTEAPGTYQNQSPLDGKDILIESAITTDAAGDPSANFTHDASISVKIVCRIHHWHEGAEVRLAVRDSKRNVFTTDTEMQLAAVNEDGLTEATVTVPSNLLRPETYFLTLATYLPNQAIFDLVNDALSITVVDGGSKYAQSEGLDYGCVFVDCDWRLSPEVGRQ